MNMKKWWMALFIGTIFVISGCSGDAPKAGVVDLGRVASESKVGHELGNKMMEEEKAIREDLEKGANPQSQEEAMKLQQEYQKRMMLTQQQLMKEFRTNVERAAAEIAQEKKLGIILWKEQVVTGSVDITDDVIQKLGGKVEPAQEKSTENAAGNTESSDSKEQPKP